jgi:acyl dehydratase
MNPSASHTFEQLPGMRGMMLRAALPAGKGPLKDGQTIPRIEATVPRTLILPKDLARYRQVCGFVAGERVPPTWLQVLAGPLHMAILADKSFPLPAMGIVHVRNRIDQFEPISIADTIELCAYVEGHRPHKRGVEFDLITEARRAGEVVWRAETTVLSMAGNKAGGKKSGKTTTQSAPGELPNRTHSVIWPVAEDQGRKYGAVSGDRNPIHLYALSAKLFGFNRAIVHGMWSLGRCVAELEELTEQHNVRIDVDFKRPIFLPSRVLFSACADQMPMDFAIRTPDGAKLHMQGTLSTLPADHGDDRSGN